MNMQSRSSQISKDSYSDYFSDYDCNQPLMEHAVLTATSSLNDRGPEKARLNGKCSADL
ncbi:unnamed protein product [Ceratitis capitata]|uniref:(Mediterranean fruit fly) hypothetical protein n=1 Tax=Ceratitis capitata TaxID=7213 RepID=A0A811V7Y5_CERCA|nr:unnamed protein product [Ceratitis capitata]